MLMMKLWRLSLREDNCMCCDICDICWADSPSQADGKNCVYDVLLLTFIWLGYDVLVHVQLTHVNLSKQDDQL